MAITLKNICFAYRRGKEIINCPELKFSSGNIYALVGPNGSGKTTFLKLILGLLKPTSGEVEGTESKVISFVPDYNGLYDSLTILENIKFRLSLYKMSYSAEEGNIHNMLIRYNLADEEHKLVKDLSLGMKKKVSLISAIAVRPSILILDEPTGGLDSEAQKELSAMIGEFILPSTMVICTSHDQDFLNSLPHCNIIQFPMGV